MSFQIIKNYKTKWRYIFIVIFVLFAILTVHFASKLILSNILDRWVEVQEKKSGQILSDVLTDINNFQKDIYEVSNKLAVDSNLIKILRVKNQVKPEQKSVLFEILKENGNDKLNLELIDRRLSTIAWSGKRISIPKNIFTASSSTDTSFISFGSIYSYFTSVKRIFEKDELLGYLISSKIITINYPLNNRYLSTSGLQQELTLKYGTKINLFFSKNEPIKNSNSLYSIIRGNKNNFIGYLEVQKIKRDEYSSKFIEISNNVVNLLIIFLVLFLTALTFKWYKDINSNLKTKLLISIIHLWAIRYLLLFIEFPSKILTSEVFNSSIYSTNFGYGLADNLGELFLTIIFLFIQISYFLFIFLKKRNQTIISLRTKKQNLKYHILLFLLFLSLPFILRAFGATLRSIAIDYNLSFYDFTNILPGIPISIIFITILFFTFALFMVSIGIFLFGLIYWRELFKIRIPIEIILFISSLVFITVFHLLQSEPQVDLAVQIIFAFVSLSLAKYLESILGTEKKILNIGRMLIFSLLAIIFFYTVLNEKISLKQRDYIQSKAEELIRPADNYISFLMNKTMSQISIDSNLIELMANFDIEQNYDESFLQWIKSPLSKEKYNSALFISDNSGKILSMFSIGILDRDIKLFSAELKNISQPMINVYNIGSSSLKHYIGFEPIYNSAGKKAGVIGIIVASDEYIFLKDDAPEFLRNYQVEESFSEMQNIYISEFYETKLVISNSNYYSKNQSLPEEIINKFKKPNSIGYWNREIINGNVCNSYYITNNLNYPLRRIFSLTIEELDFRWHLFNLFKIILTTILAFAAFLLVILLVNYLRGIKFHLNYRNKLLLSFLTLSIIPVIAIWFYTKGFIIDQNAKSTLRNLSEEIDIVGNNLMQYFSGNIDTLSMHKKADLFEIKRIAENTGRDFNMYLGDSMVISSRPEIYKTELVSKFISPAAYKNIIISGKNFYSENLTIGNYPYIVAYVPIVNSRGYTIGVLSVPSLYKNSITEKELAQTIAFIFGGYAIIVVITVLIGSLLSKRISDPIKKLTYATKQVMAGDLDTKIHSTTQDEIGELINSFNQMKQRLKESQKELAKIERELAWREMAKQVAHEIKNPLTPIKLSVQHLQQIYKDKVENFEQIFFRITKTLIEQIEALSRIASEFSNFAKMPAPKLQDCSINDLIRDAINLYKEEKNIDFDVKFHDNIPKIKADAEELRRVFINIIRNSIQAIHQLSEKKGKIRIHTKNDGEKTTIIFNDNGIGIPEEVKSKLFQPNFSTKSDGMGLGLAICKKIITDLNGKIEIISQENKGTEVQIIL